MKKLCLLILVIIPFFCFSQEAWRPFGSQDDFNQATFKNTDNIVGSLPSDVDDLGRVYVAFSQNSTIVMRRFSNNYWEDFAVPINETSSTIMLDVTVSGTPFLAYVDATGKLKVLKFNGSNWEMIGNTYVSDGNASAFSLQLDHNDNPYVSYRDATVSNKASVKKFNGLNWEIIGVLGFSENSVETTNLAIDSFNLPYVVYGDSVLNKLTLKKFNGINWELIGNEGFSINNGTPDLALDGNNVPYVVYSAGFYGGITIQKFDGNSWIYLSNGVLSSSYAVYQSIAIDSNNIPYITFSDRAYGTVIKRFVGSNWEPVGPPVFSVFESSKNNILIQNNIVYSFCIEPANNNRITVRKYEQNNWKIIGCEGISRSISKVVFDTNDVAYATGGTSLYYKSNGKDWLVLTSVPMSVRKMLIDSSNIIYIFGNDNLYPIKRYINGVWENVGSLTFSNLNYVDFAIGPDDTLYVAYVDNINSVQKISVKKFNGVTWEFVSTPGFSDVQGYKPLIALGQNNIPYVAYLGTGGAFVKSFNGTNWENIDGSSTYLAYEAYPKALVIDSNNSVYICYNYSAYGDTTTVIKKYSNELWETIYNQTFPNGSSGFGDFAIDHNNNSYLARYNVNEYNPNPYINVYKLNGTSWDILGTNFINALTYAPSLSFPSVNIPCVSYTYQNKGIYENYSSGGYVKYFGLENALNTDENTFSLNKINIYPNPVKNTFSITGSGAVNKIEIYDMTGKRVLFQKNSVNY